MTVFVISLAVVGVLGLAAFFGPSVLLTLARLKGQRKAQANGDAL